MTAATLVSVPLLALSSAVPVGPVGPVDPLGRSPLSPPALRPEDLADLTNPLLAPAEGRAPLDLFHNYLSVFLVAFLVTVCATPLMRRLAMSHGVVDRPLEARKAHRLPVPYLGGVGVYLGLLAAIAFSYCTFLPPWLYHPHEGATPQMVVPVSIVLGMTLIMLTGLIDDVIGLDPRLKIVGQLLAAAALAMQDFGVKVAFGVLTPIGRAVGNEFLTWTVSLPFDAPFIGPSVTFDLIYWSGTIIIALCVLGACNASNLIDGLDGLLSGVTGICAAALLVIALLMAAGDDGPRDATRIVLAMALLGACLGFLPHNFNPASIFLGDAGSLLLGFVSIVIILSLGDTGKTHYVIAGLIIFAIPIIDTALAIARRKLSGKPMSVGDDQHLHHILKRALGVKGAVFVLYVIGLVFGALGVALTFGRGRVILAVSVVAAAFIMVIAFKAARKSVLDAQAEAMAKKAPTFTKRLYSPTKAPAAPPAPEKTDEPSPV
ncbi:MAG: undecaprenyl/decaprenyl-phosphate alpha-N-acetylglucosaminyl 1-phosphate transferase [Phycisphaerales bacterium]|nr:undecaprenyl/decaprenyl-phosphate alpha-N-acetylglucosaminyl 1-phosphate transferase [Phycisphaerales bacterium]